MKDNQDCHHNGCHLSVCTCGHSNLFITHFLPNFIYELLSSKSFTRSTVGLSDEQYQNGCRFSVCTCGHYYTISVNFIYGLLSSISFTCLNMGLTNEGLLRLPPKWLSHFNCRAFCGALCLSLNFLVTIVKRIDILMHKIRTRLTLVNVYVDLVVFMHIAGTS